MGRLNLLRRPSPALLGPSWAILRLRWVPRALWDFFELLQSPVGTTLSRKVGNAKNLQRKNAQFPTRQVGVVRCLRTDPPATPPPCIPRPPDPKLSRVSPSVPGYPAPSPSTKTGTQHDRTEQSMTQHDRTAHRQNSTTEHTRAEHDRTHQAFSPPGRLGLLDFKSRPPGQPHPACRGRQTPSCPEDPRDSPRVPGVPPPRPRRKREHNMTWQNIA